MITPNYRWFRDSENASTREIRVNETTEITLSLMDWISIKGLECSIDNDQLIIDRLLAQHHSNC